jgi:hypothetical protein
MALESGEVDGVDGCGGEESWPPWVLVSPEDVAGLLAAYREACREAGRVRESLPVGTGSGRLPEVVASVDVEGRPVVHVDRSGRPDREGGSGSGAAA